MIAIDAQGRVLLLQYARPGGERFWATPGGGLEGAETFEEAAAREAREELGLEDIDPQPFVGRMNHFLSGDRHIRQRERYFLIRLESSDVPDTASVQTAHRREGIVATRWWDVKALEGTSERVFPEELR